MAKSSGVGGVVVAGTGLPEKTGRLLEVPGAGVTKPFNLEAINQNVRLIKCCHLHPFS